MDSLVEQTVAMGMAVLFFTAAIHKAYDISGFQQALRDYQVLPSLSVVLVSVLVTVSEFFLAACWLFHIQLGLVAVASIALMAIYTLAISVNLLRGRVFIDCGCGFAARDDGQPISPGLLVRNGALMLIAASMLLPVSERPLHASDYLVTMVVLAVSLLLFAASGQLLRNRAAIRSWRGQ